MKDYVKSRLKKEEDVLYSEKRGEKNACGGMEWVYTE